MAFAPPHLHMSHARRNPLGLILGRDIVAPAEAGERTGLMAHPRKIRHSCGYYLANIGTNLRTM
jgi:hypothetical protein